MPLPYDLIIVGGNTAGLAAAIHARQRGLKPLVLEASVRPEAKACGEGLSPGALAELAALDVSVPRGATLAGIEYIFPSRRAFGAFGSGGGRGIERRALHAALTGTAMAHGAEIRQCKVNELRMTEHGVMINRDPELHAPLVVGADGVRSTVRRMVGWQLTAPGPSRYGARAYFRLTAPLETVKVFWGASAEMYLTPVGGDIVNVALLAPAGYQLASAREEFDQVFAMLGEQLTTFQGAGLFPSRSTRVVSSRVALIGDAAGFLDPMTGEGNHLAMASARALIAALARGSIMDYGQEWRALTRPYRVLTTVLMALARRPVGRAHLLPTLTGVPGVMELALRAMDHPWRGRPRRIEPGNSGGARI